MTPQCGCYGGFEGDFVKLPMNGDKCLYPALVAIHAKAEADLRDARELLQRALLASAWMGTDSLAGEIERYLEKEKQ